MADTERLTVDVPPHVKRTLKAEAALLDMNMGAAVAEAVTEWCTRHQRERAQAAEVEEAFRARTGG